MECVSWWRLDVGVKLDTEGSKFGKAGGMKSRVVGMRHRKLELLGWMAQYLVSRVVVAMEVVDVVGLEVW